MAEEWRVEIDLSEEGHGLSVGELLRSHDIDDEARDRLGGDVIVTRDGSRMFLYAGSEDAAREAGRLAGELIAAEGLEAEIEIARWDSGDHAWEDISASAREHAEAQDDDEETRTGVPFLVFLESHKPEILRDLGL